MGLNRRQSPRKMMRPRLSRRTTSLPLLCLILIATNAGPVHGQADKATTSGSATSGVIPVGGLLGTATGTTGVYVKAGSSTNLPAATTITLPDGSTGEARTIPKFSIDPKTNQILTSSDRMLRFASSDPTGSITTFSSGLARWSSFLTNTPNQGVGYGANHSVDVSVEKVGDFFQRLFLPGGKASAQSKDPLSFTFSTSGSLRYDFSLGGVSDGKLSIFSSDPSAKNHLEFDSAFQNVQFGTKTLDGELFSLTIDSSGIVNGRDDLKVTFTPWDGLGLTKDQIGSVQDSIKSSMTLLPDGSVGLGTGAALTLFGPGGLLPELTLTALPGTVTYEDYVFGDSQLSSVPEPAGIIQLGTGMIGILICLLINLYARSRGRGALRAVGQG